MKKFLLLSVFTILFASCSTDDSTVFSNENTKAIHESNPVNFVSDQDRNESMAGEGACFAELTSHIYVDVSGGFTNPQINFYADAGRTTFNSKKLKFRIKLEVQLLADCEDLTSGTGSVTTFTRPTLATGMSTAPAVIVNKAQLPGDCYRWRVIVQGLGAADESMMYCTSSTQWYDAPLL